MRTKLLNSLRVLSACVLLMWLMELNGDYVWDLPYIWQVVLSIPMLLAVVCTVGLLDLLYAFLRGRRYRVIRIVRIRETALVDISWALYLCEAPAGQTTILRAQVYGTLPPPAFLRAYHSSLSGKLTAVTLLTITILLLQSVGLHLLFLVIGLAVRHA